MIVTLRAALPADIAACIALRGRTRENAISAARLAELKAAIIPPGRISHLVAEYNRALGAKDLGLRKFSQKFSRLARRAGISAISIRRVNKDQVERIRGVGPARKEPGILSGHLALLLQGKGLNILLE